MESYLLKELVLIFAFSTAVIYVFSKIKIPTIVGFLLTGVIIGPNGLGVISDIQRVDTLSQIGVIFLLFSIGLEFSLKKLWQIKRSVFIGGSLQVFITMAIFFFIALQMGSGKREALLWGILIAITSTAILFKLLQERGEIDSPHGKTAVGVSIFQDLFSIPIIILIPLLAERASVNFGEELALLLFKGVVIVVLVIVSSKYVIPKTLFFIAKTRNKELFILSIILICFAVGWFSLALGLSLALGSFLAGLIISESEYSAEALGGITPFKDVFISFFFISMGMLLDVKFVLNNLFLTISMAFIVFLIKALVAGFAAFALGFGFRTVLLVGFTLAQVGEFSFILAKAGEENGLLGAHNYQLFLAVSVITMAMAPFALTLASKLSVKVEKIPLPERFILGLKSQREEPIEHKKDHLIIIGFGINGRNLARAAISANIPFEIIEMNPETVMTEQENGLPIFYGDATHEAVLQHANAESSRVLVIAISDPVATRRITAQARRLNPKLYIIVRSRYLQDMPELYELGANEVIPEEFETSIEIFSRVLRKYLIPAEEIERFVSVARSDGYEMFRSLSQPKESVAEINVLLPELEITTRRLKPENKLVGKTIAEIELRRKHGVTAVAIIGDSQAIYNPHGEAYFQVNDIVVFIGHPEKMSAFFNEFFPCEEETKRKETDALPEETPIT